ncbi:MAG: carbohydrate kinase [bacterium]|nr:carbohydrate kinase [bacterium]MCX7917459.1 carbohydrate kinase [bacterium]MDW8163901.1 carbohydrate kinase [Candidatus Omnitrophota bacterium]
MGKVCVFGEVLFDIIENKEYLGGAPFNLSCHLKIIGVDVIFISAIGKDKRGEKILKALDKFKISKEFLNIIEDKKTGIVNVLLKNGNPSFEIVYPAAWDFITLSSEKINKLKKENIEIFCFGSLALREKISRNTFLKILNVFDKTKKFCDINLRKPFYNKKIIEFLLKITDILKLNDKELIEIGKMFGIKGDYEGIMRTLMEKFDIEIICTTLGENGAIMLWNGNFYKEKGISVEVVDTVGAGDAFSAGFIKGYIEKLKQEEILKNANKLGAFVCSKRGAIPDYKFEDILTEERNFNG